MDLQKRCLDVAICPRQFFVTVCPSRSHDCLENLSRNPDLFIIALLRASSYEPGNRAGSVTGTNFVVCSYGKFQPGRPG